MNAGRSVALLIETSNAYSRGVLEGVIRYIRQHGPWSLYVPEQERAAPPPVWLKQWKGDGIIARIETAAIAKAVLSIGVPVIDVSAARLCPGIPWVETNDDKIAQIAAEHLMERGFKRLAFCGDPGFNWSLWRGEHFRKFALAHGCEYFEHQSIPRFDSKFSWVREKKRLASWIRDLPRPIGVFACYDIQAQALLDVCRELDVAVPEEIAVLGVDDDHLICELCTPPLSSVIPNSHRTGYEAAALLDQLMTGEEVEAVEHLIDPLGVRTRLSTDVLAIEDVAIVQALRYIRQNALRGITVNDILREVPLSRRVLESRFRKILGRTVHQEITRLRMDRVKQLLSETELPLTDIAYRAGYEYVEYLSYAFKRETGQTPSDYRKAVQAR